MLNSSQAWANMAQYMRDAITAQGAGPAQALFGNAMAGMRGSGIPFPGGKSRQPTPLGTPVGARQLARMMAPNAVERVSTTTSVVSPGQTQVIRPSQQQTARRASAPQAGASSSLITSTPSPAEVALATTSLLGG